MREISGETLRVLLAIKSMEHGGGAESLVFNIYNELKKRPGIEVKLIAFEKAGGINNRSYFEEQLSRDPDFYLCGSYVNLSILRKSRIDISAFMKIVNDFKPHIIHSHLFIAELISREVIFPGVKYFTHTHDNMKQFENFSLKTLFTKELLTNFYEKKHLMSRYNKANNNFIAISGDTQNYFEKVLPKKLARNIFHLNNAIVANQFKEVNGVRDLTRLRIVNVGRFDANKNQIFLVEVCEELVKRGQEIEITLLGDGELYPGIKALIKEKGLQRNISMPGNVVNVKDYYGAANIYVHTANHESFGLVIVEAMASGLPVVSLDARGNRGLIKEGFNGYMLYEQDKIKFADAIEKIVKDENAYRTMSENATVFAQQYDIKPYVNKLLEIYKSVG